VRRRRWPWVALVVIEFLVVWAFAPLLAGVHSSRRAYNALLGQEVQILIAIPVGLTLWYLGFKLVSRAFWKSQVRRYGLPTPTRIPRRPDR
jgi:hypothetical protein